MAVQLPTTLNLCRVRGDTFPFTVVLKSGTTAIDITGFAIVMTVDPSDEPTTNTNNLFQASGVVTDGPAGKVTFTLTSGQADQTPGDYFYDMQYTDGAGAIRTFAKGTYQVIQDVTK